MFAAPLQANPKIALGIACEVEAQDVADLLQAALAEQEPSLRLLQRGVALDFSRERLLPHSGMGAGGGSVSPLAQADIILRLSQGDGGQQNVVNVEAVSVLTGLVLLAESYPHSADTARIIATARVIVEDFRSVWPKVKTPPGELRVLSLPKIFSINGARGDAGLLASINFLLRQRLQANPHFILVERFALDEIVIEREGRAELPEVVVTPLVFGGTVDEFASGKAGPIAVTLSRRTSVGGVDTETFEYNREKPIADLVTGMATWIEQQSGVSAPVGAGGLTEPAQLLQRAHWCREVLLHEEALELLQLYHFLQQPSRESTLLQFQTGATYFASASINRAADPDRLIATAVNYVSFVEQALEVVAASNQTHTLHIQNFPLGTMAGIVTWHARRDAPSPEQLLALAALRGHLERLVSRFDDLPLDPSVKGKLVLAGYRYRMETASAWNEVKELYTEAFHKGMVVRHPKPPFEVPDRERMSFYQTLLQSEAPPEARFELGVILCDATIDLEIKEEIYRELWENLWERRDTFLLKKPSSSVFRELTQLSLLQQRHPTFVPTEGAASRLIAYVLENSSEPIRFYDGNTYAPYLKLEADIVRIMEAAQASRDHFAASNHPYAREHLASINALIHDISLLQTAQGVGRGAALPTTWYWCLYTVEDRPLNRRYFDQVRGLTYHNGSIWCTNGYSVYQINLDGVGERMSEYPPALAERYQGQAKPSFDSLAVSDDHFVLIANEGAGAAYQIYNRATHQWQEVKSPFPTDVSAEEQVFSVLTSHQKTVYRPVVIRGQVGGQLGGVEVLDLIAGTLSYLIRGDRAPRETPMDVAGSRFMVAGFGQDGGLLFQAQPHGRRERVEPYSYYPESGKWRQLTASESQGLIVDQLGGLHLKGPGMSVTPPANGMRPTGLRSRSGIVKPPVLLLAGPDGTDPREIPLALVVSEKDQIALEKMWEANAIFGGGSYSYEKMIEGSQIKGRLIPEGLIITSNPDLGFFFISNQAIAEWR